MGFLDGSNAQIFESNDSWYYSHVRDSLQIDSTPFTLGSQGSWFPPLLIFPLFAVFPCLMGQSFRGHHAILEGIVSRAPDNQGGVIRDLGSCILTGTCSCR